MSFLLLTILMGNITEVNFGLASVYNDKIYACPKKSYEYLHLPIAANRSLPCGTVINVKRIDTGKTVKAVIGDRGPFGACVKSKYNTRACGHGSKWINGRKIFKNKTLMNTVSWRGILDMSVPLAKELGIKNRLIPVLIYTDFANSVPSSINLDTIDSYKVAINNNNFNTLTSLVITN